MSSLFSGFPHWASVTMAVCGILAVVGIIMVAFAMSMPRFKHNKCKRAIDKSDILECMDFLSKWELSDRKPYGYHYLDGNGCYVIFTYKNQPTNVKGLANYDNVLVGSGEKMFEAARAQFRGRGVKEVFDDLKNGYACYVRFFPCDVEATPQRELELIEQYNAMESYNKEKEKHKKKKKRK